jgi:hypothetical protein
MSLEPSHVLIAFGLVVASVAYFAGVVVSGWVAQTNRRLTVLARLHERYVHSHLHAIRRVAELEALQEVGVIDFPPGDDDDDDPSDH